MTWPDRTAVTGWKNLIPRHFFYLDMLYQYAGVCLDIVSAHQL